MIDENDVIDVVCSLLKNKGYDILQKLTTKQQGDDIIAYKSGKRLFIEAKGETSSDKESKRFGKPFESSQVKVHVAEAVYKAIEVLNRNNNKEERSGIALPDNKHHRQLIERVKGTLDILGIAVFWVSKNGSVLVDSPWEV